MPRAAANAAVTPSPDPAAFIARWQNSGAAERANYQLFLSELCDLLGVARPDPTKPDDADNAYVFERSVTFHHPDGTTSTGRIDLYKRGCYVLEAKQGVEKREAADQLDAAVAEAYGLPSNASDDAILTHLCALNAQRAAGERAGKIRWLRPEFQSGKSEAGGRKEQAALGLPDAESKPSAALPKSKAAWPKTLSAQVQAVEAALLAASGPVTLATLAKAFTRAPVASVAEILDTLATLGRARKSEGETYSR